MAAILDDTRVDDLEAVFLHARFLRFFVKLSEICRVSEHRLDDHACVIRSVILQCEQQSASEDLIQLLDLVHEEVNGLIDQSQDLCDTQRNFAAEMGFSCPV